MWSVKLRLDVPDSLPLVDLAWIRRFPFEIAVASGVWSRSETSCTGTKNLQCQRVHDVLERRGAEVREVRRAAHCSSWRMANTRPSKLRAQRPASSAVRADERVPGRSMASRDTSASSAK